MPARNLTYHPAAQTTATTRPSSDGGWREVFPPAAGSHNPRRRETTRVTPFTHLHIGSFANYSLFTIHYSLGLSVDPMSGKYPSLSPYVYCADNPIKLVDPNGEEIEVVSNEDGTYTVIGGTINKDKNIYIVKDGKRTGEILGQAMTEYSFFNEEGNVVKGATIDLSDNSGQNFIDEFIKHTPDLHTYVFDKEKGGQTGGNCDFKNRRIPYGLSQAQKNIYHNRGMSITINGKIQIASARDIGNYAAGYIAGATGIPKLLTRFAFDVYQRGFEPQVTKAAENLGYARGKMSYILHHPQHWK